MMPFSDNTHSKIAFVLGHPAHYHYYKNVINELINRKKTVRIFYVSKDVLSRLVNSQDWDCVNFFPESRRSQTKNSFFSLISIAIKSEYRLYNLIKDFSPNLILGTDVTIAHVGKLLDIKTVIVNEDDTSATPENYFFYPFATYVVLPNCCDTGMWSANRISFNGYQELAYLHPNYFEPDRKILKKYNLGSEKYFVIRLVDLSASHDFGKRGLNDKLLDQIITKCESHGRVYIINESEIPKKYVNKILKIDPSDALHILAFSEIVISDSQTMTAESAILGTPTLRYNDFVGELSYLDEIENYYGLGFGVKTSFPLELIEKLDFLLSRNNLKKEWETKKTRLLKEKIDVCEFLLDIIEKELRIRN